MARLLLIGSYPLAGSLPKGGVQASTYGLAHALQSRGNAVVVLDPLVQAVAGDLQRNDAGVEVHHLALPRGSKISGLARLGLARKILRQSQPAICNIHGAEPSYLPLLLHARRLRIPVVFTVHGLQFKEQRHRFRDKPGLKTLLQWPYYALAERLLLALAPAVIVDTDYVRQALGLRRKPVYVIPQGILHRSDGTPAQPDRNLLLTIGAISRRKGHHFAIRAFAQLSGRHPEVRYHIVGTLSEPDYFAELRQLILDLRLTEKVRITADAPSSEVMRLMDRAGLFLLHSQEESQGIALCEALSRGIPVVATDVAAIPCVVPHERVGLLSPYGNVAGFAANIERLLQDDACRARMSIAARDWSRQFDWEQITPAVEAVFRERGAAR